MEGTHMTEQESKVEIKHSEFLEYCELKKKEDKRLAEAKRDFSNLLVEVKEDFLDNVPLSKRDEIITQAKLDLLEKEMVLAREKLLKLNSPLKDKEISALLVNYKNFKRLLSWNKVQLDLIKDSGEIIKDKNDKVIYRHELEFNVDKLKAELSLMEKELEIYGIVGDEIDV
jgi:hypothetical protein